MYDFDAVNFWMVYFVDILFIIYVFLICCIILSKLLGTIIKLFTFMSIDRSKESTLFYKLNK